MAARADPVSKMLGHPFGHEEMRLLWPAISTLGGAYLVLAERFAVGRARVLLVWGPVSDVAVDDDQGRAVLAAFGRLERPLEQVNVVGVAHARNVPSVAHEARGDVLAEGELRVPLDRHVVVVVNPTEVREAEVSRQGRGLAGNALHHVAVAAHREHAVVEHVKTRTIERRREPSPGYRHADARGDALAQGTGRGLDARG